MSEEQNVKNEPKNNQRWLVILTIVSLLFSISALTISSLTFVGVDSGSNGGKVVISKKYDKGKSLQKALNTGKPVLVFFYTDWCGFCQKFAPTYYKISKNSKIKKNFAVAYVNCEKDENRALMSEYGVQGFPSVFVIDNQGKRTQLDNNTFFSEDSKDVVAKKALELIGEDD